LACRKAFAVSGHAFGSTSCQCPFAPWRLPLAGLEDRLGLLDGSHIPTSHEYSYPEGRSDKRASRALHQLAVGVFGSYGRGTAGVGSDLDLLLILRRCDEPI
jgi:hypothetical protein